MCGLVRVRAQISRQRGFATWVPLSQAAMHSCMFLPVAPPDEPPLVAKFGCSASIEP